MSDRLNEIDERHQTTRVSEADVGWLIDEVRRVRAVRDRLAGELDAVRALRGEMSVQDRLRRLCAHLGHEVAPGEVYWGAFGYWDDPAWQLDRHPHEFVFRRSGVTRPYGGGTVPCDIDLGTNDDPDVALSAVERALGIGGAP